MIIKIYNLSSQKGAVSILLAMSILSAILGIALGSSLIAATQTKTSLGSSDSAIAYYAAETGIEYALYEVIKNSNEPATTCGASWENVGSGKYCLTVSGSIAGGNLKVQSIGDDNKSTRRSVEISF